MMLVSTGKRNTPIVTPEVIQSACWLSRKMLEGAVGKKWLKAERISFIPSNPITTNAHPSRNA